MNIISHHKYSEDELDRIEKDEGTTYRHLLLLIFLSEIGSTFDYPCRASVQFLYRRRVART